MTTLVQTYIKALRDALRTAPGFPARVEDSPVRAHTRADTPVVSVLPGAEVVADVATPCATRQREVHLLVHTAGDDHLEQTEATLEAAQPIVMAFQADSLVSVEELRTDEPRYANGDLTRQVVTKRFLLTYQTNEDSLSQ